MKYKAIAQIKRNKVITKLKRNFSECKIKKLKISLKIPKEIITKLQILEKIEGSYFTDSLVKTLKGEYF